MFPVDFAFDIVAKHSRRGQALLDPFRRPRIQCVRGGCTGQIGM